MAATCTTMKGARKRWRTDRSQVFILDGEFLLGEPPEVRRKALKRTKIIGTREGLGQSGRLRFVTTQGVISQEDEPCLLAENDFIVDGQQRRTTLSLLLTFLADAGERTYDAHRDRLRYESRPRATEALRRIAAESSHAAWTVDSLSTDDVGIHQGFNVIQQYMDQHISDDRARRIFADFLLDRVTVVRVSLPAKTDRNRYFEVMNTRGQQLQQVDIVKARLMSQLDDAQRSCFAWLWDACADMNSYVQMSLTRGNTELRTKIFGDNWSWLCVSGFEEMLVTYRPIEYAAAAKPPSSASFTLDDALTKYAEVGPPGAADDQDNVRFRSTIDFSTFLLHVLKVKNRNNEELEGDLDDKRLIRRFDEALGDDSAQWVREFAFELLRCRNLFDSFILSASTGRRTATMAPGRYSASASASPTASRRLARAVPSR